MTTTTPTLQKRESFQRHCRALCFSYSLWCSTEQLWVHKLTFNINYGLTMNIKHLKFKNFTFCSCLAAEEQRFKVI